MKNTTSLTVTVGIPTYYGGQGLVKTVKSVLASAGVEPFRLIVCVDGNPLNKEIAEQLGELGAEIITSETRGGQRARIKQMVALCDTDILILTQDDVLFSENTVLEIKKAFAKDTATMMISGHGDYFPAKSFFEKVMRIGKLVSGVIGEKWNKGDSYMQVGGRCLAFRSFWIKGMPIREEVLNSDVNFYFLNKKLGGRFQRVHSARYFVRCPQTLSEHLKQSRKFQLVAHEVKDHFDMDIGSGYTLPPGWIAYAVGKVFISHPIQTVCYAGIWIYTRIAGDRIYTGVKRFWETDISTKEI